MQHGSRTPAPLQKHLHDRSVAEERRRQQRRDVLEILYVLLCAPAGTASLFADTESLLAGESSFEHIVSAGAELVFAVIFTCQQFPFNCSLTVKQPAAAMDCARLLSRVFTMKAWPRRDARCSAVSPLLSLASMSTCRTSQQGSSEGFLHPTIIPFTSKW